MFSWKTKRNSQKKLRKHQQEQQEQQQPNDFFRSCRSIVLKDQLIRKSVCQRTNFEFFNPKILVLVFEALIVFF
jgi:hypothetical protein